MGERLTNKDRDELEKFIGKGSKSFELLYAISRDGCYATTFHEKCDNQGPTVTVLYNDKGSVYGGYNPSNWKSCGGEYSTSNEAFLFQLYFSGKERAMKFPVKQEKSGFATYNDLLYGPTFGGGYDLRTYIGTINRSGNVYPLNGHAQFGHSYDMQGVLPDGIHNGNFNVIELEVYKVTLRKPWRDQDKWDTKESERLKEAILAFTPIPDLSISKVRVAMIGPVGAGKSSFFNTIDSIFRERITWRACSSGAAHSVTAGYVPYTIRPNTGGSPNFILCDMPGLEESVGPDVNDCCHILDGHIQDFHLFNQEKELTPKADKCKVEPTKNRIHCVIFVLDATTLDTVSEKVIEKMKQFQRLMNEREIPQLIVLTKIDKICNEVEKDVSFTYKSWAVEEHVKKASQLLGLSQTKVFPVKNYKEETKLDNNVNILALLALSRILESVEDYMLNLLDRQLFGQIDLEKK